MHCDILVIGAGVLGLSSAYHLKKENPRKYVLVVDKFGGAGQGNSAKSTGGFRNLFTSKTNYILADSTIEWFKHIEKIGYDINYHQVGYLWLLSDDQYKERITAIKKIKEQGVETSEYSKEELKESIPDLVIDFLGSEEEELLNLEPVDVGIFGHKCGTLDPDALARSYERQFIQMGGKINYNTKIEELLIKPEIELGLQGEPFVWQETRIDGGKTREEKITAETTVIATGVWSEGLLTPIGYDPFMRPKKRQLFAFKDPKICRLMNAKGFNKHNTLPLTILPKASIFIKGEITEGSIWTGCADSLGRKFEFEEDPQAEADYYTDSLYHVLSNYLPCFTDLRPMNFWAGQYAVNSYDEIPVVTSGEGFIYVGAASGSGIMKSDAIGRIVNAAYNSEEVAMLFGEHSINVSDLGIEKRKVEREEFII
jgi:glycine/D-amino acid oxidase-like deaminating enzyme